MSSTLLLKQNIHTVKGQTLYKLKVALYSFATPSCTNDSLYESLTHYSKCDPGQLGKL